MLPRILVTTALSTLCLFAAAQEAWAVQTAAFRDFREATGVARQLQRLGYDAYTEFTMHGGRQYSRVRVGCFFSRPLAEDMAARLGGHVTEEAAVVPYTPGARAAACVTGDIGFRLPPSWGVEESEPGGILLWVEVAGRRGYLAYNGRMWRVAQSDQEAQQLQEEGFLNAADGETSTPRAMAAEFGAGPAGAVVAGLDGKKITVAFGKVLWRAAGTAVVQAGDRITALGLVPPR